jgi:hypothetical protein
MLRLRALLALALAASALPAQAQSKTYTWTDTTCENTIRYDPRKVDRKALESTTEVLNPELGTAPLVGLVASPAEIAKLDPDSFAKTCTAQAARMRAHTLLPVAGIEALRQLRVRQIDDDCALRIAEARGYRDPSALRSYAPASPHCDRFVDALEGRSDLVSTWRRAVAEGCANNASPAACRQRHEAQGAGPEGDAWRRLYLVTFAWNNCAIRHSAFGDVEMKRRDAMFENVGKAFRRTYGVKRVCDEP